MEVRGHILPPGTYSPAGVPAGRLQELRERQRGLRQALGLRLRELRRLCLQEAELTGKLPPEYPLEPGERPQPPPRRRSGGPPRGPPPEQWPLYPAGGSRPPVCHTGTPTSCRSPHALLCRARLQAQAQAQAQVQAQVLEAARRLAAVPGLPPEQRRRRQRLQAEAAQRLRQLRAQIGAPGHDENGSLCDLPALENGALPPPGRPSPPRAGSGSPERRPLPPPWSPEAPPGRRSSLASPASPARTLPRSASSFEGRSVPATPVLGRSPRGNPPGRPDAPGLPPRPWSGSQDSQLGGPPAPCPPPPGAPRTRRSNSSEALIDWGGGGGGGGGPSETPPEASRARGVPAGSGVSLLVAAPPPHSAEQRRSQKWLALEGLRDWYLRHTGTPPGTGGGSGTPPGTGTPPSGRPGHSWAPPPRRRDPPALPHSLSYAGALAPRASGDTPGATPPPPLDPQPPGTLV